MLLQIILTVFIESRVPPVREGGGSCMYGSRIAAEASLTFAWVSGIHPLEGQYVSLILRREFHRDQFATAHRAGEHAWSTCQCMHAFRPSSRVQVCIGMVRLS